MKRILLLILCFMYTGFSFGDQQQATLSVPTMNCVTCPITVKKALTNVEGVISAKVSYETKEAKVQFDDATTNIASLITATTNAGYPAHLKSGEEIE